jgi:hypothetical protein
MKLLYATSIRSLTSSVSHAPATMTIASVVLKERAVANVLQISDLTRYISEYL